MNGLNIQRDQTEGGVVVSFSRSLSFMSPDDIYLKSKRTKRQRDKVTERQR